MKKNRILTGVNETARGLNRIGVLDQQTMRQFDVLTVPPVRSHLARPIRAIRARARMSQAVFAGSAQHRHLDRSEMGNWCGAAEWSVAKTSQCD